MTRCIHLTHKLVILGRTSRVVHVSQMVLALDIVLMLADELVLIGQLEEECKELQQFYNYLIMAFLERKESQYSIEMLFRLYVPWRRPQSL